MIKYYLFLPKRRLNNLMFGVLKITSIPIPFCQIFHMKFTILFLKNKVYQVYALCY